MRSPPCCGPSRARGITGSRLPIVTDGGDQAVVELGTLIAPWVVALRMAQAPYFAGTGAQRIAVSERHARPEARDHLAS